MAGEYRLQIIIDVINRATPEIKKTIEEAKKGLREFQEIARTQETIFQTQASRGRPPAPSTLKRRGLLTPEEVEKELRVGESTQGYLDYVKKIRKIRNQVGRELAKSLSDLYKSITGRSGEVIGEDLAKDVVEVGSIKAEREKAVREYQEAVKELVSFSNQYKGQLSNLTGDLAKQFNALKNKVKHATLLSKFYQEADKLAQRAVERFEGFTEDVEDSLKGKEDQIIGRLTPQIKERYRLLQQYREALLQNKVPKYIEDIQNVIRGVSTAYQNAVNEFSSLLEKPIQEGGLAGTPETEKDIQTVHTNYSKFIGLIDRYKLNLGKYLSPVYRGLIPEDLLEQIQKLYDYLSSEYERFLPHYRAISEAYLGAPFYRKFIAPYQPPPQQVVPYQITPQPIDIYRPIPRQLAPLPKPFISESELSRYWKQVDQVIGYFKQIEHVREELRQTFQAMTQPIIPYRPILRPLGPLYEPKFIIPYRPILQPISSSSKTTTEEQEILEYLKQEDEKATKQEIQQSVQQMAQAAQAAGQEMQKTAEAAQEVAKATGEAKLNLEDIKKLSEIQTKFYQALQFKHSIPQLFDELEKSTGYKREVIQEALAKLSKEGLLLGPFVGSTKQKIQQLYGDLEVVFEQLASDKNIKLVANNVEEFGIRLEALGHEIAIHPEYNKRLARSLQDYGRLIRDSGAELRVYENETKDLSKAITDLEGNLLTVGDIFRSKLASTQKPSFFNDLFGQYKDLNRAAYQLMWTGFSMLMAFRPIVSGIGQAFHSVAQYGLETQWFAERLGMSIQNVQALRVALAYSNESIDHFATSLAVLSRKVYDAAQGSGVGVRALKELGIQVTDVNGEMLPFEEILGQLIARIQALKEAGVSSAQISAYLTKIFGRENTKLALFLTENIDKITERLNKAKIFGLIYDEGEQATATRLMEALNDMRFAWEGFTKQMIVGAAGVFIPLINWIRDYAVAFTKLGSAFRGVGGIIIGVLFVIAKVAVVAATSLLLVAGVMRAFIVLQGVLMALKNVFMGAAGAVTVFGVSMGPVALIIVGLLTLLGLFLPQLLGVGRAFREASKGSSDFLKDMQEAFKTFSDLARNAGEDFMDSYAEGMKMGFPYARKVALEIAEELFQYFGGGHSPAVKGPLANLEYWGADFLRAYREGMKDEVPNILSDIKNIGQGIVNVFNSIPQMIKGIGSIVDSWAYSIGQRLALSATGKMPFGFQDILGYLQQIPPYILQSIKGVINNFQNTLTNSFTSIIDKLINSFEKLWGMDYPQSFLQRLGKGFFDTIGAVAKSEIGNFFQSVFAPVYGFIDTFFGNLMSGKLLSQLTDWARQQISAISAQREFISVISSAFSNAHATGTITTQPHLALVGEEGPEAIIPLSSHRRKRALQLWIETGKKLGVVGYAEGGIVGGTVENLEDWVQALGSILINAGNAFRTGILAAIERWKNAIRDLPKKIDIDRKIEIPEVKRQTTLLESIRISFIQGLKVLDIIEKHLSNIKGSAQNQISILNRPSKVQKILEIVETDDKNLRNARQDFLKLLQQESKKPALDINWDLLYSSQYTALSNLGPLLKEGKEGQDALKRFLTEFEIVFKQSRGGIITAQELSGFESYMNKRGLTQLKDFLIHNTDKQKLYENVMKAFEEYHKGNISANKLWEELKKYFNKNVEYKVKNILTGKEIKVNVSGLQALGEAVDALAGEGALDKINKSIQTANKYLPQIRNTLEQRVKEDQKNRYLEKIVSAQIPSKTDLKLPPEFVDSFIKVMFSSLSEVQSGKGFLKSLTDYFQIGSKEPLNFNNVNKQMDNLIKSIENTEKDFQEGRIITKEYIEKMQEYNTSISDLLKDNSNVSKAIGEYIKQYQKAKGLSIQLQQALEMIRSGKNPQNLQDILNSKEVTEEISEETRKKILSRLEEWQKSENKADVFKELESVLTELINGLDTTAEIYYQGIDKLNNKLNNLVETQNKVNQVANKWLVDAKNTLLQAMNDWSQGDFKGAAMDIADYFRKAFQEGLVDTFMKDFKENIDNLAKSFANIALWLLGGRKDKAPTQELNNIWNSITPIIDKGILQPISNFALRMLNFWTEGTKEREAFKALTDPKNWEETANAIGNAITEALAGEKIANMVFPEEGYIGKITGKLVDMANGIADVMKQIVGPEKIQATIDGFRLFFVLLRSGTDNIIKSVKLLLTPSYELENVTGQLKDMLGLNKEELSIKLPATLSETVGKMLGKDKEEFRLYKEPTDLAGKLGKILGIDEKVIREFLSTKLITLFPGTSLQKDITIESVRDSIASMLDKVKGIWDKFFKETPIGKAAAQVGGFIKAGTVDLIGGLMGGPLGSFIGGFISQGLVAVLGELAGMFSDVYEGFLKDFIQIGKAILKPIIIPILQILANVLKVFMDVLKPFVPLFKVLAEIIGMIITLIGKIFLAYWNTVLKPVIFAFTKALSFVIKGIGYLLKPLDWLLGGIGQKLINAANAMSQAADEMYKSTGEAQSVEETDKKKDQPISIANLTGNALEGFKQLLAPLNSLNLLPSYFQQMNSYLKEIRDALVGTNPAPAPATAGGTVSNTAFSREITINNLNIYVDEVTDIDINKIVDQVIYQVGVKVNNLKYARGG